jgi:Flp pilus assembly protein TadB
MTGIIGLLLISPCPAPSSNKEAERERVMNNTNDPGPVASSHLSLKTQKPRFQSSNVKRLVFLIAVATFCVIALTGIAGATHLLPGVWESIFFIIFTLLSTVLTLYTLLFNYTGKDQ